MAKNIVNQEVKENGAASCRYLKTNVVPIRYQPTEYEGENFEEYFILMGIMLMLTGTVLLVMLTQMPGHKCYSYSMYYSPVLALHFPGVHFILLTCT